MAEVGSAFVSILPSAKGFGSKLDSQVGGEVDSAGKKVGKGFGTALKVGALAAVGAGAAIGSFLKGAVDQASDLNEQTTKIEAIFGKGSAAVQKFAEGGAATLGQTKLDVLDASATFGVFGKAAGLSGKDLAKFSTGFTTLSTDLASFNNKSPEEAVQAIGAALRGEAEPMRQFGVLLDDATLRNEALKLGLIKTTKDALTPQQKVLAAQAAIYKQTGDAQGDFQKTSGGLANQQRILSAQWSDMKTSVGVGLLPIVTRFVTFLNSTAMPVISNLAAGFKTSFLPALTQVGGAIKSIFDLFVRGDFTGAFRETFGVFEDSPIVAKILAIRQAVITNFGAVQAFITSQVVPRFREIVTAVQGFVSVALPIVQAFVAGMRARIEPMLPTIRVIFTQIGSVITGVMGLIQAVIQRVTAIIGGIWSRWGTQIMNFAAKAFSGALTIITGVLRVIQGVIKTVTSIIKGDWSGAWNGIQMILSGVWTAIKGIVSLGLTVIKGAISAGWAVAKTLTALAWNEMEDSVRAGIAAVIGFIKSLPGKAKAALGNLGSLLYSAGRDLIQGLINGVKDMAGSLVSAAGDVVGNAISAAKSKLGISSPSKVFREIGEQTMQGMIDGLKGRLSELRSAASDIASAVSGAFTSDAFSGTVGEFFETLRGDVRDLKGAAAALKRLRRIGVSDAFLSSLMQSGNAGLIRGLSSDMNQALDADLLFQRRASLASGLGAATGQSVVGAEIRGTNQRLDRLNDQVKRLAKDIGRELNGAGAAAQRRRTA